MAACWHSSVVGRVSTRLRMSCRSAARLRSSASGAVMKPACIILNQNIRRYSAEYDYFLPSTTESLSYYFISLWSGDRASLLPIILLWLRVKSCLPLSPCDSHSTKNQISNCLGSPCPKAATSIAKQQLTFHLSTTGRKNPSKADSFCKQRKNFATSSRV